MTMQMFINGLITQRGYFFAHRAFFRFSDAFSRYLNWLTFTLNTRRSKSWRKETTVEIEKQFFISTEQGKNYAWECESGLIRWAIVSILLKSWREKHKKIIINISLRRRPDGFIAKKTMATRLKEQEESLIKSQPEMIRCAKITHEKNRAINNQMDWKR